MDLCSIRPRTTKCKTCFGTARVTRWLPPKGIDPYLREYKCNRRGCGSTFRKARLVIEYRLPSVASLSQGVPATTTRPTAVKSQ